MALTSKVHGASGKAPLENLRSGGFVGDACSATAPCREGLHCAGLFSDGRGAYPQGMCTTICPKGTCPDDPSYPSSRCVTWPNEPQPICMVGCNERGSCDRVGYECGRADRADGGSGFRYLCTPRPGSARNALAAAQRDGVAHAPLGTMTVAEMSELVQGGPAEFSPSARYSLNDSAPLVAPTAEEALPPEALPDVPEAADAEPEIFAASTEAPAPVARRSEPEGPGVVGWSVIGVVGLVTVFVLIRLLTSSRVGGVLRELRSSTEDETPLERIRREDREKRRTPARSESLEVRVSRRLPTRPLRPEPAVGSMPLPSTGAPVISREEAQARQLPGGREDRVDPAPVDEPSSAVASSPADARVSSESPPVAEAELVDDRASSPDGASVSASSGDASDAWPPLLGGEGPGARGFGSSSSGAASSVGVSTSASSSFGPSVSSSPERPSDWMSPPDAGNPLMDVGRPFVARLWGGARAAKPYGVRRFSRMEDHLPTLIEMDEFVSPLPLEVVTQLLDELLEYAEDLRQKKGYDAIVYVEADPRRTWFRRGPEGRIRLHHAPDAFSKPALASDVMRRKGFPAGLRPQDAHWLSLVHLGRFLLGSAAWDDVFLTLDDLASASSRFSHEETQLVEYLLAPEENENIRRMAESRRRASGMGRGEMASSLASATPVRDGRGAASGVEDFLPCPNCASEIVVGDLACRHCGVALHPRPVFCSSCGSRNLVFADGREQPCLNLDCGESIVHSALQADVEGRRLSIIADLLSSFDEFRKLSSRGDQERYEALQGGRRVEIWQVQSDRGTVVVEDMRPQYGLDERVTLPARQSERSGLSFIVYDPPSPPRHPLYSLGGEGLAEQLLSLLEMIHDAKLRVPGLSTEDLTVSDRGEVCLTAGHRLRVATQPTPRVLDSRFVAPELARQALATERSDLYTIAAIWFFTVVGAMPHEESGASDDLMQVPELVRELMLRALKEEASDRPESARAMLLQLRKRRRLTDLV